MVFYLATDQQGINCYKANDEWLAHPEWHLKDDHGNVVNPSEPKMDTTNAEARKWWLSIPLSGDHGTGTFKGQPVAELIDGVLADSGGWSSFPNVSVARLEAISDAKMGMLQELQQQFTKANGGIVMANGISMYGGKNADPRYPGGHNLRALDYTNAIMNEHTAVFESVNSHNASFNVDTGQRVTRTATTIMPAQKVNFVLANSYSHLPLFYKWLFPLLLPPSPTTACALSVSRNLDAIVAAAHSHNRYASPVLHVQNHPKPRLNIAIVYCSIIPYTATARVNPAM